MDFNTKILNTSDEDIKIAVNAIKNGEIVAIPTETVYGLAANVFNEKSIKKIFKAKGRPQDNPLIVHISDISQLDDLIINRSNLSNILIEKFWPGPLTIVFEKSKKIPSIVSAGLDTVAIRFPSDKIAKKIIRDVGFPLAAPSANTSGKPSPTTAQHVYKDLKGKIPYIVDGSSSEIGLESTVISLATSTPRLLRPGKITIEQLKDVISNLEIDESVLTNTKIIEKVLSPGMKYKHYAPDADLKLFNGSVKKFTSYANALNNTWALCFDEDISELTIPYISYGKKDDFDSLSKNLFSSLREFDKNNVKNIIAHAPLQKDLGLSIYNRLLRSANFEVINSEEKKSNK